MLLKGRRARETAGIKINEAFQRQQGKSAAQPAIKQERSWCLSNDMLQVPSTSHNQLPDRCGDMIQFQDGKRNVGVAPCHVFQVFTIIQLKQIYTTSSEAQSGRSIQEETTSGRFGPIWRRATKIPIKQQNTHGCQTNTALAPTTRSHGGLMMSINSCATSPYECHPRGGWGWLWVTDTFYL